LNESVAKLKASGQVMIPGEVLFRLYDTFGFPLDLVADMARDMHLELDEDGYRRAMQEQREKARAAWAGSGEEKVKPIYKEVSATIKKPLFVGYSELEGTAEVLAIIKGEKKVTEAHDGDEVEIVLDRTPFYAESGGQVGDTGELLGEASKFDVKDTTKPVQDLIVHKGKIRKGTFKVGDAILAKVESDNRADIARHHTVTHILHATLRSVLGEHVKQAGSLVSPERLRFDFTHYTALTEREKERIEELVNERILENHPVDTAAMDIDQAIATGAMALFDEKYGDKVRVVTVKEVSKELCGGTHTRASGDIGMFKIISEAGIAAGVRRIEALAGRRAYWEVKKEEKSLQEIAHALKASDPDIVGRVEKLVAQLKESEKELDRMKHKMQSSQAGVIVEGAKMINGVRVLARRVENMDQKDLRDFGDKLRDNIKSGVLALGSVKDDKVSLIVMVSKDLTTRFHAGTIIKEMAPILGGTGGGKADLAQSGGKDPGKLDAALDALYDAVKKAAK
jgi:alanyl-tRNA synthetase